MVTRFFFSMRKESEYEILNFQSLKFSWLLLLMPRNNPECSFRCALYCIIIRGQYCGRCSRALIHPMSTLRPEASVGFAGLVEDMEREIVSRLDRPSRFVFAYTTRAYYALYRGVRAKELYTEDPYNVGDTFMDALIAGHLSVMEWCLSFVFNPSVENVIKANIMYSAEVRCLCCFFFCIFCWY